MTLTTPSTPSNCILSISSEEETILLASIIAEYTSKGDVFLLDGTLGVGKSTFARAFIRALKQDNSIEVPSPTFTLVQVYEAQNKEVPSIWHFDLYRLESPDEVYEVGLEEALSDGVSLIEWPDRLGSIPIPNPIHLAFSFNEQSSTSSRRVTLTGGASHSKRLEQIKQDFDRISKNDSKGIE